MWYRIARKRLQAQEKFRDDGTNQYDQNPQDEDLYDDDEDDYDFYDEASEARENVLNTFVQNPKAAQPWSVVPAGRLQKIWADTERMGFVRDVKGIDEIADVMVRNTLMLNANTELAGHTPHDPVNLAQQYGHEWTDELNEDFGDHILDAQGQWRISDYAMEKLMGYAEKLRRATTPLQKLTLIDLMLGTVHARSDIAGMFIEGGSKTLSQMFAQH